MGAFSGPFICSCFCSKSKRCARPRPGARRAWQARFQAHLLFSEAFPPQTPRPAFAALFSLLPNTRLAPESAAFFAPCLIAAKPVKPCDGGVFGAFYLLLKTERNTLGGDCAFHATGRALNRLWGTARKARHAAPAITRKRAPGHAGAAACRWPGAPVAGRWRAAAGAKPAPARRAGRRARRPQSAGRWRPGARAAGGSGP